MVTLKKYEVTLIANTPSYKNIEKILTLATNEDGIIQLPHISKKDDQSFILHDYHYQSLIVNTTHSTLKIHSRTTARNAIYTLFFFADIVDRIEVIKHIDTLTIAEEVKSTIKSDLLYYEKNKFFLIDKNKVVHILQNIGYVAIHSHIKILQLSESIDTYPLNQLHCMRFLS